MRCVWVFLDFFRCAKFTTIFKHLNMTSLNKIFNSAWFSFFILQDLCFYSSGLWILGRRAWRETRGGGGGCRTWWSSSFTNKRWTSSTSSFLFHLIHRQTAEIHVWLIHRQSCTPVSDLIYSCLCGSLDHFKSYTVLSLLCKFPDKHNCKRCEVQWDAKSPRFPVMLSLCVLF